MTEQRAVRRYAHMCRMDHEQIGHNDSEHEQCPLCRAQDERDVLSTELAEAKAEIERMREALECVQRASAGWPSMVRAALIPAKGKEEKRDA